MERLYFLRFLYLNSVVQEKINIVVVKKKKYRLINYFKKHSLLEYPSMLHVSVPGTGGLVGTELIWGYYKYLKMIRKGIKAVYRLL